MSKPIPAIFRKQVAGYLPPLIALVLIVGILIAAQEVIVPLALAVLLAFVLTPLVIQVQSLGLPRVPAALSVAIVGLLIVAAVGWGVEFQVARLAEDMPAHRQEIHKKLAKLSMSNGPLSRAIETFQENADAKAAASKDRQIFVERPPESPLKQLTSSAGALLPPIASGALVLVLVVFMLIRREDLRNRVIGLLGHGRLTGTTRVLVESADRLSRFLLTQLTINAAFGAIFGLALLIIGVPYWFLWGFLAVILRFVPFIGSWIAAALPLLVSVTEAPGWTQPLLVLVVFVGLELFVANVAEPLLVGHSTGVSPVALLIAAVFWAWVWGPIGLVLATPLTVCLVVLGQHVPQLWFLSMLLSDQPPLPAHASYYQRLLAGDRAEALGIARTQARSAGIEHLPDDVFLPAMVLARRDRANDGLTAEDESFVFDSTRSILKEVEALETKENKLPSARNPALDAGPLVLGLPAHHRSEELTLQMLDLVTRLLPCRVESVGSRVLPVEIESLIERETPAVVFVAILPPGGTVQARYLIRRLMRKFPDLKIVVGYFGRVRDFDRLLVKFRAAGASYVMTTLLQSRSQIEALLPPVATNARVEAVLKTAASSDTALAASVK